MELNAGDDERLAVQYRYARWLAWSSRVGLAILLLGFTAYVVGWTPHVPIEHLPSIWQRPSADYLQRTGLKPGWHWAALLHRSDMLVLAGIALLASCSLACLAAVIPEFARRGERAYVVICLLEIGVLATAASGVIGAH